MIQGVQGDFDPTSSPFNTRNWTWGMAGIGVDIPRSNNSLIVNNLPKSNVQTESFANNNTPFTSGSNISIQASDGSIFDGVVIWIGPGPRPPTPSTTTTTPGPTTTSSTTTSSTTTSSTTTSSTTTSSTTTTTTTPPPGYAYSGVDCDGNPVTIYTANSTFNSSDPAFTDDRLTSSFSGYFIYGFTTYLYTNGIAAISTCPTTTTTTTSSTTTTTVTPPPTTTTTTAPP